jgi:hypothetical protein
MEALAIGLVVGGVTFVLGLAAWLFGRRRQGKKRDLYLEHLTRIRPDLAPEFLMASRVSKSSKFDIALAIDTPRRELIVMLFDDGEIADEVFPFSTLENVDVEGRIISRGPRTSRTYSYERTLALALTGGRRFQFVLENISDKHGRKGTDVVKDEFAPWEFALGMIVRGEAPVG